MAREAWPYGEGLTLQAVWSTAYRGGDPGPLRPWETRLSYGQWLCRVVLDGERFRVSQVPRAAVRAWVERWGKG